MNRAHAKQWLRQLAQNQRRHLSPSFRTQASQRIQKKAAHSPAFKKAKVVAVYLSFGSEVETGQLIHRSWALGKTVLIPSMNPKKAAPFFSIFLPGTVLRPPHPARGKWLTRHP